MYCPPPITTADNIPIEEMTSAYGMEFSETCQMLNYLGIRQLMFEDVGRFQGTSHLMEGPHVRKLFGCMYNPFGICDPISWYVATMNIGDVLGVICPQTIYLTNFQQYHLEHFSKEVIVFSRKKHQSHWIDFAHIHAAVCNFVIEKDLIVYLPNSLSLIVSAYMQIATSFSCRLYDKKADKKRKLDC